MDKKVVFLVGNGFNYFLKQYVNEENKNVLLKKLETEKHSRGDSAIWLEKLKKGLDEYCGLLDFLNLENYSETGETLLSKLNNFFEKIKSDDIDSKPYIEGIDKNLQMLIINRIDMIFKETAIVSAGKHNSYINATARKIMFNNLKKRTFAKTIDDLVNKVSSQPYDIYTTNYDFITESVFVEFNGHKSKPKNFLNGDHYTQLHGKYKISKDSDIICCSPKNKEEMIKRKNKDMLDKFFEDVKESDIIVLFGMGLTSDPHILREINKKEDTEIVIVDADKKLYYDKHYPKNFGSNNEENKFKFLVNNHINFIDTSSHEYTERYCVNKINSPEKLMQSLEDIFESFVKE